MKDTSKNFSLPAGMNILLRHFTQLCTSGYYNNKLTTKKNFAALDLLFSFAIDSLTQLVKGKNVKKYFDDNSIYFLALIVLTSRLTTKKEIKSVLDAIYEEKYSA